MTEETDSYRGIVLKESLIDGVLPPAARRYLVVEYPYALDGKEPMTVFRLTVPAEAALVVAENLSHSLLTEKFFAQLTGRSEMLIVFPGKYVTVLRDRPETASTARLLGNQFGIPDYQMKFEKMFDNDHPNTNMENRNET